MGWPGCEPEPSSAMVAMARWSSGAARLGEWETERRRGLALRMRGVKAKPIVAFWRHGNG